MRVISLIAGLVSLILTVTPVAASPDHRGDRGRRGDDDHGDQWNRDGEAQAVDCQVRGQAPRWRGDWRRMQNQSVDCSDQASLAWWWNGSDWERRFHTGRWGIFKDLRDGLSDDQADALSDELQDCVSTDNIGDMRLRQLKQLVFAIGLTDRERRHIHDREDLSDVLSDRLDSDNIQDMKVNELLQVAHACGLSNRDVFEIVRDA